MSLLSWFTKVKICRRGSKGLLTDANTLAALSKAYLEESGRMPFLDQESMQRYPLHTPWISQKFASK